MARFFYLVGVKNFVLRKSLTGGFTLMEILMVVTLIGILSIAFISMANYHFQLKRGADSKRKSDLTLLKAKMEDYYNDNNQYPSSEEMAQCGVALNPYLNVIPCDPRGTPYFYETDNSRQWFRIYANLENEKDKAIQAVGCQNGCYTQSGKIFNYGVSSSNTRLSSLPFAGARLPTCDNPWEHCNQIGACCEGVEYQLLCWGNHYWCQPL